MNDSEDFKIPFDVQDYLAGILADLKNGSITNDKAVDLLNRAVEKFKIIVNSNIELKKMYNITIKDGKVEMYTDQGARCEVLNEHNAYKWAQGFLLYSIKRLQESREILLKKIEENNIAIEGNMQTEDITQIPVRRPVNFLKGSPESIIEFINNLRENQIIDGELDEILKSFRLKGNAIQGKIKGAETPEPINWKIFNRYCYRMLHILINSDVISGSDSSNKTQGAKIAPEEMMLNFKNRKGKSMYGPKGLRVAINKAVKGVKLETLHPKLDLILTKFLVKTRNE